jgi:hypothetical protein
MLRIIKNLDVTWIKDPKLSTKTYIDHAAWGHKTIIIRMGKYLIIIGWANNNISAYITNSQQRPYWEFSYHFIGFELNLINGEGKKLSSKVKTKYKG